MKMFNTRRPIPRRRTSSVTQSATDAS